LAAPRLVGGFSGLFRWLNLFRWLKLDLTSAHPSIYHHPSRCDGAKLMPSVLMPPAQQKSNFLLSEDEMSSKQEMFF